MKEFILIIIVALLISCSKREESKNTNNSTAAERQTIVDNTGTYKLVRPKSGPDKNGIWEIELWEKVGVSTNDYVYMRTQFANGENHFTRISP